MLAVNDQGPAQNAINRSSIMSVNALGIGIEDLVMRALVHSHDFIVQLDLALYSSLCLRCKLVLDNQLNDNLDRVIELYYPICMHDTVQLGKNF